MSDNTHSDEDGYISDPYSDIDDNYNFPQDDDDVVEFGWQDERKISGRRKKAQQAAKKKAKPGSFETMGLSEPILKGIRRKGYRLPTPIQRKAMPLILQGIDVVGMARTGSGKTAAFVIPLLQHLLNTNKNANNTSTSHTSEDIQHTGVRGVILSPTRELALQTAKVIKELGRHLDIRTAVLVGGDSMEAQFAELAAFPDVIIATPGRLAHHLTEISGFTLKTVDYVVFDEADRLFEMGFADQLREITGSMLPSRQTLLFSATMPRLLAEFARAGLRDPQLVRLDADAKLSPDLALAFFTIRQDDKPAGLLFMLREVVPAQQLTIVFAATKHHVEFLATLLKKEGIDCTSIHGSMDQSARKINIAKFRTGKSKILIVTDVAARGIDIPLLDNVINYNFPAKPKLFVHRCGRAARAGRHGTAYSLVTKDELPYLVDLHLFLSRPLVSAPVVSLKAAAAAHAPAVQKVARHADADDREEESTTDAILLGGFPQTALDDVIEHVRGMIDATPDLQSQLKATENAMSMYVKTRPLAAPESARRAKSLSREGIHPLIAAAVPSDTLGGLEAQECLADITAKLRSYRPAQTVFEAEVASARAGQGSGLTATPGMLAAAPYERRIEVMKKKREAHTAVIAARKRKAELLDGSASIALVPALMQNNADTETAGAVVESDTNTMDKKHHSQADENKKKKNAKMNSTSADLNTSTVLPHVAHNINHRDTTTTTATAVAAVAPPSNRFRDDSFYISHTPSENHAAEKFVSIHSRDRIDNAVMDLNAEDAEGVAQQRAAAWHWDVKSKKYVKLQKGEVVKAGKRVMKKGGIDGKKKGGNKNGQSGGLYEKWSKKTKLSIGSGARDGISPHGGSGSKSKDLADAMSGRFKHGGRGWKNPFKAKNTHEDAGDGGDGGATKSSSSIKKRGSAGGARRELKTADEVRKARKTEEKKKARAQGNGKPGGGGMRGGGGMPGGRGGGRGGGGRGGGGRGGGKPGGGGMRGGGGMPGGGGGGGRGGGKPGGGRGGRSRMMDKMKRGGRS